MKLGDPRQHLARGHPGTQKPDREYLYLSAKRNETPLLFVCRGCVQTKKSESCVLRGMEHLQVCWQGPSGLSCPQDMFIGGM